MISEHKFCYFGADPYKAMEIKFSFHRSTTSHAFRPERKYKCWSSVCAWSSLLFVVGPRQFAFSWRLGFQKTGFVWVSLICLLASLARYEYSRGHCEVQPVISCFDPTMTAIATPLNLPSEYPTTATFFKIGENYWRSRSQSKPAFLCCYRQKNLRLLQ